MLFDELLQQAEAGDTEAMRKVALAYLNGDDVEPDLTKATDWISEAAVRGNAEAQYEFGDFYHTTDHFEDAFHWFEKAANQGLPHAQHTLAVYLLNGIGTEKDIPQAVDWLKKAVESGHVGAKVRLGAAYIEGIGVSLNKEKGISLLQEAANEGNEEAKKLLTTFGSNSYKIAGALKFITQKTGERFGDTLADQLKVSIAGASIAALLTLIWGRGQGLTVAGWFFLPLIVALWGASILTIFRIVIGSLKSWWFATIFGGEKIVEKWVNSENTNIIDIPILRSVIIWIIGILDFLSELAPLFLPYIIRCIMWLFILYIVGAFLIFISPLTTLVRFILTWRKERNE